MMSIDYPGASMSVDDLRASKINERIACEAFTQVERRLADVLDTKKIVEQKAISLFSSYVTISMAVFGIGAALLRDPLLGEKAWPLFLAGLFFMAGTTAFLFALREQDYGAMGSAPSVWLRSGVIDGPDEELARMFAYLTKHIDERIAVSLKSNERKFLSLQIGMGLGIAGAIVFAGSLWVAFRAIA